MSNERIPLKATIRVIKGKQVKNLRIANQLPAVIYGKDQESQLITLDQLEFSKVIEQTGETGLIEVDIGKAKIPCIVRDQQVSPVKNHVLHVDFFAVDLKEKIEADIPLIFIGQSAAVVDEDGTLIEVKSEIHVEALPTDLVHEIEVDISSLKTFEDALTIADIKVPAGITILDSSEDTIAKVEPPRSEEELAALEEKPAETEAEAIEKVESETKEGTAETPAEAEAKKSEDKSE